MKLMNCFLASVALAALAIAPTAEAAPIFNIAEKSPVRCAAVGTVAKFSGLPVSSGELAGSESRMPS